MSQRPPDSAAFPAAVLTLAYAPIALWLVAQTMEGNFPAGMILGSIAGSLCIWRIVRFINRPERVPLGDQRDPGPSGR